MLSAGRSRSRRANAAGLGHATLGETIVRVIFRVPHRALTRSLLLALSLKAGAATCDVVIAKDMVDVPSRWLQRPAPWYVAAANAPLRRRAEP